VLWAQLGLDQQIEVDAERRDQGHLGHAGCIGDVHRPDTSSEIARTDEHQRGGACGATAL